MTVREFATVQAFVPTDSEALTDSEAPADSGAPADRRAVGAADALTPRGHSGGVLPRITTRSADSSHVNVAVERPVGLAFASVPWAYR